MSLESIPTYFSDTLDISLAAAQVILSIVVIFSVLLPVIILTKGKSNTVYLITFFLTEAFLVGIGWLAFWVLIATVALMAFAIASLGTNAVVGK